MFQLAIANAQVTNLDSAAVATMIGDFVEEVSTVITDNIGVVLIFAAGILAWFVLKKWVFGGARKI